MEGFKLRSSEIALLCSGCIRRAYVIGKWTTMGSGQWRVGERLKIGLDGLDRKEFVVDRWRYIHGD